jgi:hypothetical protein
MMIKTAELTGAALDWAVSACIGIGWEMGDIDANEYGPKFKPSTDWADGGPIIEQEKIALIPPNERIDEWEAVHPDRMHNEQYNPTPLVAAMRCFVASRLGDEVEIPEGLA